MPRANWHTGGLRVDRSDPFATPPPQGERIDLTDPVVLQSKLTALLLLEGKLDEHGITCALKARPDSCCSACPLRDTSATRRIRQLCNLGVEQERTLMKVLADDA